MTLKTQIYQTVIKLVVLLLFVIHPLHSESIRHLLQTVTGPNGQDCTPSSTDAPNACPIASNGSFTGISGTQIQCEENFDCCTCSSIRCGSIASSSYCSSFQANGNSSALYVYPISIIGDPGGQGASIQCNGHKSCEGTQIQGRYIREVKCTATRSCADTNWFISCSRFEGCAMECDGIESCSGTFTISHTVGLNCGPYACSNGLFTMQSTSNFTKTVSCVGTNACNGSEIHINDVAMVKCMGEYACADTVMTITDPVHGFALQCKGYRACQGMTLTVEISATSAVSTLIGFDCASEEACEGANIVITNKSPMDITIGQLNCAARLSCAYAAIELQELDGLVVFETCDCGNKDGCLGTEQVGVGTPIQCLVETTTTDIPTTFTTTDTITTTTIWTPIPTTTTRYTPSPFTTTTKHTPKPTVIIKTPSPHIFSDSSDSSYSISSGSYDSSDFDGYGMYNANHMVANGGLSALKGQSRSVIADPYIYDGTIVNCKGDGECQGAQIEAMYIEKINCGGRLSCAFAQIRVTDPKHFFSVECHGANACEGLVLEVIFTSDSTVKKFDAIECVSAEACADASISIINRSPNTLIVEELNCKSWRGCAGASFSLFGSVLFETCRCGANGCLETIGIDQCFDNLDRLECKASGCADQSTTITNPSNGFKLVCDELRSCHDFELTVVINDNAKDFPVQTIQGVSCGYKASCKGLVLNIVNEQTGIVLNVDSIECMGHDSCESAVFAGNGAGNVVFDGIVCNGNCGVRDDVLQCKAESNGEQIFCGHSVFE